MALGIALVAPALRPSAGTGLLDTTGHGSVGRLECHGVELGADRVVGDNDVVSWLTTHATLGRSAFQLGVVERALELTAEYAREREQFDRPIGSFQAVSSRLADGYIDIKGLRLTVTQAACSQADRVRGRRCHRTAAAHRPGTG